MCIMYYECFYFLHIIITRDNMLLIYSKVIQGDRNNAEIFRRNLNGNHVISIMNWNPEARNVQPLYDHGAFNRCGHYPHHCSYTTSQRAYNTSDVVVLDASVIPLNEFPKYRHKDQRWLFNGVKPPSMKSFPTEYSIYDDVFNISTTFTTDADLFATRGLCFDSESNAGAQNRHVIKTYGELISSADQYTDMVRSVLNNDPYTWTMSIIGKKTGLVMWKVNTCRTESARETYVSELDKFINVDVYGKCKFSNVKKRTINDRQEWDLMINKYRFYLAFENNLCADYTSENLYKALSAPILPIVLGNVDYASILPPRSFVDVRDFKSASHLGRYLNYLSRNHTAYSEYFKWKKRYVCFDKMGTPSPACQLCKYLNDNYTRKSRITSISQFWSAKKRCKTSKLFYKYIEQNIT